MRVLFSFPHVVTELEKLFEKLTEQIGSCI